MADVSLLCSFLSLKRGRVVRYRRSATYIVAQKIISSFNELYRRSPIFLQFAHFLEAFVQRAMIGDAANRIKSVMQFFNASRFLFS